MLDLIMCIKMRIGFPISYFLYSNNAHPSTWGGIRWSREQWRHCQELTVEDLTKAVFHIPHSFSSHPLAPLQSRHCFFTSPHHSLWSKACGDGLGGSTSCRFQALELVLPITTVIGQEGWYEARWLTLCGEGRVYTVCCQGEIAIAGGLSQLGISN